MGNIPTVNNHKMVTRSKIGISKRKQCFVATDVSFDYLNDEPSSFSIANKYEEWRLAMSDEFTALQRQGTWDLVPLPSNKNAIGNKWVFRLKKGPDGSVSRYKARLVDRL